MRPQYFLKCSRTPFQGFCFWDGHQPRAFGKALLFPALGYARAPLRGLWCDRNEPATSCVPGKIGNRFRNVNDAGAHEYLRGTIVWCWRRMIPYTPPCTPFNDGMRRMRRDSPVRVKIEQGEPGMGDTGKKDKGKKEKQKKAQRTPKEKRKDKKDKKRNL